MTTALGTLSMHTIAGHTFKASAWTAGHLNNTIARLKVAHPAARLKIWQPCYNTGVDVSKGTHDLDGVFDVEIIGLTWSEAQRFLRNCGWAAWHRYPPTFALEHIHMATIPPGLTNSPTPTQIGAAYVRLGIKVGLYIDGGYTTSAPHQVTTSSQVSDYFRHALGLKGEHDSGDDRSYFPPSITATVYKPGATVTEPKPTGPPILHTHVVNQMNNEHVIDIDDLSAIQLTGKQPYADAANVLHDAIANEFRKYVAATKGA